MSGRLPSSRGWGWPRQGITGRAIAGRLDEVILGTKGRNAMGEGVNDKGTSRGYLMSALEASLQRLGTDHIDLY